MISYLEERIRTVDEQEFLSLLGYVLDIIKGERRDSRVGSYIIDGCLVNISRNDMYNRLVFIGDLHGDLDALLSILERVRFPDDPSMLIFLGDYGDRGVESVEVYYTLLYLKAKYQDRVVMLRGNHEGPEDLPFYPHDLPFMLESRFAHGGVIYSRLRELFDLMYTAVYIECLLLALHGGLPIMLNSLDDIAYAHKTHPKESYLLEILWNDPREIRGWQESARGYGYYFGKDVTQRVLNAVNARMLVRAHEPCNGYKVNHDGLVLTLFSCKVPYGNSKASYLVLSNDYLNESNEDILKRVEVF